MHAQKLLFLSRNNTRLSEDLPSLGFTSVSSPGEVVYYFLPGITGQSRGYSGGTGLFASAKIPPQCRAGDSRVLLVGVARCPPWVQCPWGSGVRDAAGGVRDAAQQQDKENPQCCEFSARLL